MNECQECKRKDEIISRLQREVKEANQEIRDAVRGAVEEERWAQYDREREF